MTIRTIVQEFEVPFDDGDDQHTAQVRVTVDPDSEPDVTMRTWIDRQESMAESERGGFVGVLAYSGLTTTEN